MTSVRKRASVAPATVTAVSKETVARSRTTKAPSRQRNPVTASQVHPEVMAVAFNLAGGDPRRLKIVSTTEVLVTNAPREIR